MKTIPCALCGYDAPREPCPHCGGQPEVASLARPLRGPLRGVWDGVLALPVGVGLFLRTPGVKRWMVPPLLFTFLLLLLALWWLFGWVNGLLEANLPPRIELDAGWAWLESLPAAWDWLHSTWLALVAAAEWLVNVGWALLLSEPLRLLFWFLLGSLASWYLFSIAYEALAGPFLDEIQARLEARWFGIDPRSTLERPNDIPAARCTVLTLGSFAGFALAALLLGTSLGPWLTAALLPLAFIPATLVDRRYGPWLRWVASIEGRALWASLQATALTSTLLLLALPLYFVPGAGYFLFAAACGFATAVGLLDIPFERRGWDLRMRARFVGRNLLPFLAFGTGAGLLLAVPVVGPVLMVPSASLGGLWLVCRLDKRSLREA